MSERRRSEVFNGEAWEAVSGLEAVRKGCAFRMIEPDGTLFELQGRTVFIALEDGYMDGGEGLVSGWVFASDAEAMAQAPASSALAGKRKRTHARHRKRHSETRKQGEHKRSEK